MKVYMCLLAVLATISIVSLSLSFVSCNEAKVSSDDALETEWHKFKVAFNKTYESEGEELRRFEIWLKNRIEVAQHNHAFSLGLKTSKKEINKFSDLEQSEIPMGFIMSTDKSDNISLQQVSSQQSTINTSNLTEKDPTTNQGTSSATVPILTFSMLAILSIISTLLNINLRLNIFKVNTC